MSGSRLWWEVALPPDSPLSACQAPLGKSPLVQNSAAQKYTQEALIRDAGNRGSYFNAYGGRGHPPHRPCIICILRAALPWHQRHSIMDG